MGLVLGSCRRRRLMYLTLSSLSPLVFLNLIFLYQTGLDILLFFIMGESQDNKTAEQKILKWGELSRSEGYDVWSLYYSADEIWC